MLALAGAFGIFHLAQQGIQLGHTELAAEGNDLDDATFSQSSL